MDKYYHVNPFSDATLNPIDHRSNLFASKEVVLNVKNVMSKATSVKKMFQSGMFDGENTMSYVRRP